MSSQSVSAALIAACLAGLARALEAQGRIADADAVRERFERAWARADVEVDTTGL